MNWREMLKDKRFLAAAAAVAAVGVFVLVRKKTGAAGDAASADAAAADAGGKAFNTSGTDMASWVSAYTTSVLDALRKMQENQQPTPNTPPPSVPPPSAPAPVPRVPGPPGGYTPVPRFPVASNIGSVPRVGG